MLKKIKVGNKIVPVPVPLKTLKQAMKWVEETFMGEESIITKVVLDGAEVEFDKPSVGRTLALTPSTELEVFVESPKDLCIHLLDAVSDLSYGIEKSLRLMAFHIYDGRHEDQHKNMKSMESDIRMTSNLIAHLNGIVDKTQMEMGPINGIDCLLKRVMKTFQETKKNQDWKQTARLMLNRMEPLLKDLVVEAEKVQMYFFTKDVNDQCELLAAKQSY